MRSAERLIAIEKQYYEEFNRRFGVKTENGETTMSRLNFYAACAAATEIKAMAKMDPEIGQVDFVWNQAGYIKVPDLVVNVLSVDGLPLSHRSTEFSTLAQEFLEAGESL